MKLQKRNPAQRLPARHKMRRVAKDAMSLLFSRVIRVFSNPFALCVLGVAATLYLTHLESSAEKNFVSKIVARLQKVSALRPLANWVHTNAVHFVGLVCFAVPALLVVPARNRALFAFGATLYVLLIPQAAALDYVWQAGLVFAWFIAKERQTRWLVAGIASLAYSLEWVSVKL